MEYLELKLKELKQYIGNTDEVSRMKFNSILSELEAMELTEQEHSVLNQFMFQGLNEVAERIDKIELLVKNRF